MPQKRTYITYNLYFKKGVYIMNKVELAKAMVEESQYNVSAAVAEEA